MCPPIKKTPGPSRENGTLPYRCRAFTLVELLVSMAVLALVMAVTVQMVGKATSITTASNKQIDASSMARITLDRIGTDFATAALTGGASALSYSGSVGTTIDPAGNSSLGFVCKTRARKMLSAPAAVTQDVRGVIVGYKIRPTTVIVHGGSSMDVPLINRGDAEFTFLVNGSTQNSGSSTDKYGFSLWDMFGVGSATALPTDLSAVNDTNLLTWQGFGDGVLRLHISFVLDDGRIVQSLRQSQSTPPLDATYNGFQSNGGPGDCLPIAFSAATSADKNKRFVTGMIVGIVVVDRASLEFGYALDSHFADTLAGQLKRPVNDGETPLGIWQANLGNVTPPPIRQSIRFYQRFYSVNL